MPFHAPARLARTTKTPVLDGIDDLSRYLEELWSYVDEAKRDRAEIDIHFHCNEGGSPESDEFDVAAHLGGIEKLAKLGVTWVGSGTSGVSIDRAIETLDRYGREVIAKASGIGS